MSLRKSPTRTPALLEANRANARKSTGPRTLKGKNRIVLNALKEGRHARDFGENLRRAKSQGDAELFQWILDQVNAAFRLHGWQENQRKAERLAQQVWCELGREERRLHAFAQQLGKGCVRFRRRTATLWALPWTPRRLGGVGTNPEYAVISTDKFLTSLSRIQVRIKDQRNVPLLKFWVRRSPLRPLPRRAEVALEHLAQARLAAGYEAEGKAEKNADMGSTQEVAAGCEADGANPECALKSIDSILTSPSRIWD
jgi:hypothetical protein